MQSPVHHRRQWRAAVAGVASCLLLLTAFAAGPVGAQSPAAGGVTLTSTTANGITGNFLAGQGGMTLYYFTLDGPGTSNCTDKCAGFWPPLAVTAGQTAAAGGGVSGVIGTITRADGSTQVTYDGRPLHYFSKDTKAGDVNGQGVAEIWFVAAVDGSVPAAPVYTIATGSGNAANYLTGEDGMTLYFFAKDTTPGVSTCTGDCQKTWLPYQPGPRDVLTAGTGVTGVIGIATQADGSKQATYDGRPLYYFSGDKAAGDVNGQGIGGVWFAATVDGTLPAAS
jgi:predicted lipoprotein with Yx(FWY)xxD motif